MATAGLNSIGTGLDQAADASPGHLLPDREVDEFDPITGHPAVDEYDTTIG